MTRTSIVSRWATDDTLVKKAVEEDLKHNHVQKTSISFKKIDPNSKVDHEKEQEKPEDDSDYYENISKDDGGEGGEAEVQNKDKYAEIIPIPKSKLSKEAQRLFPVEDFKSNKESNKESNKGKAKHILPTGPKIVKSKTSGKHPNKHIDGHLHIISPPPSREKNSRKEIHTKKIIYTGDRPLGDQKNVIKKKTDLSSKWASKITDDKRPISPPNSSGNEKEIIDNQKVRKIRDLEREGIRRVKSGRGLEWDDGKRGANGKERHFKVSLKDNYEDERFRNKNRNKNDHAHVHTAHTVHALAHTHGNANVHPIKNGKNNRPSHKQGREPHKHFAFDDANDADRETTNDYDDDEEIEVDNAAIEAVMAKLKDASIDWTADDNDYF